MIVISFLRISAKICLNNISKNEVIYLFDSGNEINSRDRSFRDKCNKMLKYNLKNELSLIYEFCTSRIQMNSNYSVQKFEC